MNREVMVGVAWPYANGPLHVGHVAGSLLAPDAFARYQRLRGASVLMVSGSDMHGTPITVAAESEGVSPETIASRNHAAHREALHGLGIYFDLFTSTATANHAAMVHEVFLALWKSGTIVPRNMTSPFDPARGRFLPDRYVEGTCPHCAFDGARGDQCDKCGRTLEVHELLNARSKLSGAAPEYRETEHFFLRLSSLQQGLETWAREQAVAGSWRPAVRNFTERWLADGLKDRPITRDLHYGITIPEEVGRYPDKRIYVWFEAVIGYLAASVEWAAERGEPTAWERFWRDSSAQSYYFLGKDNVPFHTIIWPAIISAYNDANGRFGPLAKPFDVPANEFLMFGGTKFSKSRGKPLYVLDLLQDLDANAIRYYLFANMPERGDAEWVWTDFVSKVNDQLVATVANYANRVLAMCQKNWGGVPPAGDQAKGEADLDLASAVRRLDAAVDGCCREIASALEAREFRKALRGVVALAEEGNRSIDAMAPWAKLKQGEEGTQTAARQLRAHLRVLRALAIVLQPFLPTASEALWIQLGDVRGEVTSLRSLSESSHPRFDVWPSAPLPAAPDEGRLGPIKHLVQKIDPDLIAARYDAPG